MCSGSALPAFPYNPTAPGNCIRLFHFFPVLEGCLTRIGVSVQHASYSYSRRMRSAGCIVYASASSQFKRPILAGIIGMCSGNAPFLTTDKATGCILKSTDLILPVVYCLFMPAFVHGYCFFT